MSAPHVGTVWSVRGLPDAVIVIAGPFSTPAGRPEYLIAPLYTGVEEGFVWTSEDVRLDPDESGLGQHRFAAIWNARPMLAADFGLQLGELAADATTAVRDAYWASLNERPLGPDPRLGKPIRSAVDPAAAFQARELDRWEKLSGRVFEAPDEASVRSVIVWNRSPTFVGADLGAAIEESETLLGPVGITGRGPCMVWLSGSFPIGARITSAPVLPDLFSEDPGPYVERGVTLQVSMDADSGLQQDDLPPDLGLAA